jgi:zinc protease
MDRYFSIFMLAVLWLCAATAAQAGQIHEFMLDNGLRLIVREDHRTPVVASQVWYKTGSVFEEAGKTGLAHLLEHMMFKGTQKHPMGEFSRIMAENGADENAFTSYDFTAYVQQLEASRLAVSFELEADRMQNVVFDAAEFKKEQQVVLEERRLRTEDDPEALLNELFNASAFQTSPYHHPVIGWMDDITHTTVDDVKQWYQRWYSPNNATVVVVGDVEPQAVLALAKQHFGAIQPFTIKPAPKRTEVPQYGIKRVTLKRPAKVAKLMMGYKTPSITSQAQAQDWQPYALEVLAWVLDGGNSARLSKRVIRGAEIASSLTTDYSLFQRLDGLFILAGTPSQKADVAQLERALRAQIQQVQTQLVSADELQRVKAQLTAGWVFAKDSVYYQAYIMGQLASLDLDWRLYDDYIQRVSKITPEQVREVAQKYLIDDGLTVAVLEPQPL